MSFDIFGHLLTHRQTTDGNDYDTIYTYNLGGALIDETYPSGRVVKNTFDQDGNLSQVQSKKNSSSGYWTYMDAISRDSAGNVKKMQLGNGRWETADYNNRLQVTKIGLGTIDSTKDLLELDYDYNTSGNHDNNGDMLKQTIKVPGVSPDFVQTYAYDALNRLSAAEEKQSTTTTWKQEFNYDRYGNRNFVTGTGHTTTLGSCSTAVCNPTISTSTNRVSSSGYTFDGNGNMTANAAGERFGYDAENHQKEFYTASNSGSTPDATYVYDGDGRRIKKISSTETTIFVYDGIGKLVAEYSTALATTQQVSYLTQDHLGSQRIITNENGAVTDRKDFAAFGEEVTASRTSGIGYTSAQEPRQDYTGYEKDSESGLEYAQARFYNPTHGRFTSVDPLPASATIRNPQTFNRYSYVLNSPYKFTDPLGLIPSGSAATEPTDCTKWCIINGEWIRGSDLIPDATPSDVGIAGSHEPAAPEAARQHEAAHENQQQAAEPSPPPPPPDFQTLWRAHPRFLFGSNGHRLIEEKNPDGTDKYPNQCAIRLSFAFQGAGLRTEFMNTYKGTTTQGRAAGSALGYAVNAGEFKDWAGGIYGPLKEIAGKDRYEQLIKMDTTGIIYLQNFEGTANPGHWFNHVDLWNRTQLGDGSRDWIDRAEKVFFREIK